ncbi:hypothetical protein KSS87_006580 [Heliosperma pusillum]|nr:hypothetical protein KSS87_006580 [Heliosperma pusillum]
MEGVGARLGRSSSRYGTTTVFTGPVRKWHKNWVAVLEERKKENEEKSDDEVKPIDSDGDNEDQVSKGDDIDEKPDINDVPMEENQDSEENQTPPARQDLNELDLSLGLTSHEDDHDSDSKSRPNSQ